MIAQQYRELFALVARNGAINGEKAIELIKKHTPEQDTSAAQEMVEKFRDLEDRLNNNGELVPLDYVYLWTGASVTRTTLQKNIDTWTAVVKEYDDNLIPKLFTIANEPDVEKQAMLIEENFSQESIDKNKN